VHVHDNTRILQIAIVRGSVFCRGSESLLRPDNASGIGNAKSACSLDAVYTRVCTYQYTFTCVCMRCGIRTFVHRVVSKRFVRGDTSAQVIGQSLRRAESSSDSFSATYSSILLHIHRSRSIISLINVSPFLPFFLSNRPLSESETQHRRKTTLGKWNYRAHLEFNG